VPHSGGQGGAVPSSLNGLLTHLRMSALRSRPRKREAALLLPPLTAIVCFTATCPRTSSLSTPGGSAARGLVREVQRISGGPGATAGAVERREPRDTSVTIAGRRWPIGGLESLDSQLRSYAERLARRAPHEASVQDVSRRALLDSRPIAPSPTLASARSPSCKYSMRCSSTCRRTRSRRPRA
jgi:hypothetical protein